MKSRIFRGLTSTLSVMLALMVGGFIGMAISVAVIALVWG
jgi:hypothetical protein